MSVSLASAGATASAGVAGSPYAITVDDATGSGLPNYTITYVNGSLAVVPAPLIITANDLSRAYGAANPTLTATYSGFVNGEPAASLTTPVVLGTTAIADSPAGAYPIVASGAASPNYTITFRPGALTVTAADSTTVLVTSGGTSTFGQSVSFTASVYAAAGTGKSSTSTWTVPWPATRGSTARPGRRPGPPRRSGRARAITAAYAGDAEVRPSQSGAIQQVVDAATTQSGLEVEAIRNRRGRLVGVRLVTDVGAVTLAAGPRWAR